MIPNFKTTEFLGSGLLEKAALIGQKKLVMVFQAWILATLNNNSINVNKQILGKRLKSGKAKLKHSFALPFTTLHQYFELTKLMTFFPNMVKTRK